ncbi:anthranilate phosphoribosyltransferase [Akkermansiaceae bacterium]|nr:anthranilate phosphoribosyltransferase [Akkermansiaceae bacterium]
MDSFIQKLNAGEELSLADIQLAVSYLLAEDFDSHKKAAFLSALTNKKETASEITHFVETLLTYAVDPEINQLNLNTPTIDVCGTGGDKLNLFNVSTTSMFVIAASGATVIKHGNRGITSKSGGADVLEELGIKLDASTETLRKCLQTAQVGFLFAPQYHPSFKAIGPVRAELAKQGIRTIFNLIGPLLNPAKPDHQLVGICQNQLRNDYSEILAKLGRKSAWVVHGHTSDGHSVDELSTMGPTDVSTYSVDKGQSEFSVTPEELGISLASVESLQGGFAKENATILKDILSGKETGAKRDIVLLNAAAGITCAGLASDLPSALQIAANSIDSGKALEKLEAMQGVFLN